MKLRVWAVLLLLCAGLVCMITPQRRPFAERVTFFRTEGTAAQVPDDTDKISEILSQPFTFLAKGTQAYVFVSADQKVVLKFLKLRPSNGKEPSVARQKKNRDALEACQLAWTEFREQTGLVYAHLGPTPEFRPTVQLKDRKGKKISIALENTCFMIQEKAELIYPQIQERMAKNDLLGAQAVISSVCSLLKEMQQRGVVDNDPVIRRNFGLIGNRAVQIDCGMMKLDPERAKMSTIDAPLRSFRKWITTHYPELLPAVEQAAESH
jgi:hypothetical protein